MKNKYIYTLITFLLITNVFAQSNLNEYKYVIVPKQYDFLNEKDQYQLNSLTKFLLEKENFTVFFDDENIPKELANNRCLGLLSNVINVSNMFTTKLKIELKDCTNKVIFTSNEGVSREKEYKKGYHEALRKAFESFKTIKYKYEPKQTVQENVMTEPVKDYKAVKPILKETPKKTVIAKPMEIESNEPKSVVNQSVDKSILYAQAIKGGYQIVDSTPKVIMILLNTPKQDVFIVKGQDAIIYKEDGFWYLSKSETSAEKLNIKF